MFNIAHATLPSSYSLLRAQAKAALATDDEEALLLLKVNPFGRFDMLLKICLPRPPRSSDEHYTANEEIHASKEGRWNEYLCRRLDFLVSKGLVGSGRVKSFGLMKGDEEKWTTLLLGLSFDPEKAFRLVDRGPAAEDEIAAGQFRTLWGSKAELRRFKDGAIVEAVVGKIRKDD